MAMQASEMGITMDIVNKMVDATLLTADIAMVCLLHLLKMSVDEHGNDTEMTDQTLDYPRDHRQQTIRAMMERENVRMVTDLDLVIWTGHRHEAELVDRLLTLTFQATGLTAEDEMIGLQETIDLQGTEMTAQGTTALEDAMTEMTVVTRIERESVIVTGWTTMTAAEADEPEVGVEARSEIASETGLGNESHWRELMTEIGIFIVDKEGHMVCWIFSALRGVLWSVAEIRGIGVRL
jgi:hypothetical protein